MHLVRNTRGRFTRAHGNSSRREAKPPLDVTKMSVPELRKEYAKIRARSEARSPAEFDAKVRALLGPGATPAQYVLAARKAQFMCRRCAGSGMFVTGMLNGRPTGPGGDCFRCQGKGWQNDADTRRNWGHDRHYVPGGYY